MTALGSVRLPTRDLVHLANFLYFSEKQQTCLKVQVIAMFMTVAPVTPTLETWLNSNAFDKGTVT